MQTTELITPKSEISEEDRSIEYKRQLEDLKHNFRKTRDIMNKIIEIGLSVGLSKETIRADIETALSTIVKPRQISKLLPLELKDQRKMNHVVDAHSASKKIRFEGSISKKDVDRYMINIPAIYREQIGNRRRVMVSLSFLD